MKFWTRLLIFLSIAGLGLCSYYLYKEFTARVDRKGGESIGTITFKKRNASRRYTDSVIWEDVSIESEIYNYDAIRTQEYSSAVISLKDGTKIELDQNTMLVVILSEKGLDINFDRGGVSAQSGSGTANPITLNSRDATIALDKGDVSVNSTDGGMDIVVNSGNAKVAAGGSDIDISPDRITSLKNGVVESKKVSLFPAAPGRNSYIAAFTRTIPVNFTWRSEPRGEVRLEVSDSAGFRNIIKSSKSDKEGARLDLPPGEYYWRITRGDVRSHPLKFVILADHKPEQTTPYMDQKLMLTEGSEIVTFRWDRSLHAPSYEITVARDQNMSDVVLRLSSRINTISTAGLVPGTYYWCVKSLYPSAIISESTLCGPKRFTMEKMQFSLSKPVTIDPGTVTTAAPFILNWRGVQGAKSYRLDIADDTEFTKNILSRSTKNTFLKVDEKIGVGKYFWRVSALSGERSSDSSATAQLIITEPVGIAALLPQNGAVLPADISAVKFAWRDPNNGSRYLIELSDDPGMKNIIRKIESQTESAAIENPGTGSFYWKVRLIDKAGSIIAHSETADFIIPRELRIPVQKIPVNNEKLMPSVKKRIRFEWSKSTGANEYEVEVFQRIAGVEKPLMIYTSNTNYINLANTSMYKSGSYSWLVRAKQTKQGKVAAFRESSKSYFEVENVELLPPPQVKDPGVLFK